ncbi:MAG: MFS transporter, partial [Bifidobacteriales bacterium]|nr:MFS transporter [Bifidobacteriales bacterium]
SVVKLFHSIEVPLFCLPAFRYFTLHFNPKLSATLYMVGFQIASQVGQVVLSTPLGMLHDRAGDRTTFYTISVVVLVALIYGFFVLKKDDQQVDGDPFIRDSQKVKVVEA